MTTRNINTKEGVWVFSSLEGLEDVLTNGVKVVFTAYQNDTRFRRPHGKIGYLMQGETFTFILKPEGY